MVNFKEKIDFVEGYTLHLYTGHKAFEVKIVDMYSSDYLIIDNDYISENPLPLKEYIPLCKDIIDKLEKGIELNNLSLQ